MICSTCWKIHDNVFDSDKNTLLCSNVQDILHIARCTKVQYTIFSIPISCLICLPAQLVCLSWNFAKLKCITNIKQVCFIFSTIRYAALINRKQSAVIITRISSEQPLLHLPLYFRLSLVYLHLQIVIECSCRNSF